MIHRIDLHHVLLDACRASGDRADAARRRSRRLRGPRRSTCASRPPMAARFEGAALIGADGLRSRSARRCSTKASRADRLCRASHHRADAGVAGRRVPRRASCCGPALASTSCIIRCATHAVQHRGRVPHFDLCRAGRSCEPIAPSSIAPMRMRIRHEGAAGDDRSRRRWAIADRDPIRHWARGASRCSATPRIRRCNRWRRAPAWRSRTAVCLAELIDLAGGDFEPRSATTTRALSADRAGDSSNRAILWDNIYHVDGIEREVVHWQICSRAQAKRTCSNAWPGSMTASRFPAGVSSRQDERWAARHDHIETRRGPDGRLVGRARGLAALRQGLRRRGRAAGYRVSRIDVGRDIATVLRDAQARRRAQRAARPAGRGRHHAGHAGDARHSLLAFRRAGVGARDAEGPRQGHAPGRRHSGARGHGGVAHRGRQGARRWRAPYVIKPIAEGSSVGVFIVTEAARPSAAGTVPRRLGVRRTRAVRALHPRQGADLRGHGRPAART